MQRKHAQIAARKEGKVHRNLRQTKKVFIAREINKKKNTPRIHFYFMRLLVRCTHPPTPHKNKYTETKGIRVTNQGGREEVRQRETKRIGSMFFYSRSTYHVSYERSCVFFWPL